MLKSGNNKKHLAIFASGRGSNAKAILDYFKDSDSVGIKLIVTNNKDAGVLELCKVYDVEAMVISKEILNSSDILDRKLNFLNIDLIVLAGFLWLIPERLVIAYPKQIINIHPALLPKFGGKGMYGYNVHQAVKKAGEVESGITIHYVDENYDEGRALFQAKTNLDEKDTPDMIAAKVLKLEHFHFPRVIKKLLFQND